MTDHPRGSEELGRALDAHALTVVPTPPPIRAVLDAAHRRTARRRAGALVACGAAFLTAVVLVTVPGGPPSSPAKPLPAAPPEAPERSPVRIVTPGEKVTVWRDQTIWLTGDGRQCDQLRSARPSCLMMTTEKPSVGPVIGTVVGERAYWSGHFTAPGAARIVARAADGVHPATMVVLAGESGWGGWYTSMPAGDGPSPLPESLIVYNASGKVIVEQKLSGDGDGDGDEVRDEG
ncbi:hypothetical protein [Streptomyces sp. NPDC057429]|uniref:hypothetical protein n=1 Tax=Streptomyces sp. NPDC057429 TaxID=3346130 RepID=UPI0036B03B48